MPKGNKKEKEGTPLLTAKEIYKDLNKYVVGQEEAKKALSVTLFLHTARTLCAISSNRTPFKKSNLMLIGPTGVGKTYMMQLIEEISGIPVFNINAKDLSSSGYVGTSLEDCFEMFVESVGGAENIATAESGIVFIDEFDKICIQNKDEVSGFSKPVQYSLLKAIEGNDYSLSINKREVTFSTNNVLFVLGGSFQHMRDKRKKDKDLKGSPAIGFGGEEDTEATKKQSMHEELTDNGVIRELAGRISTVSELFNLTRAQLRKAFISKKDSVFDQYKELLKFLGKDFKLSNYKINSILDECLATSTGARGLQTALDLHMREYMFNLKTSMTYEKALKKRTVLTTPGNEKKVDDSQKDGHLTITYEEWQEGFIGPGDDDEQ